jgi:hypothetical protein
MCFGPRRSTAHFDFSLKAPALLSGPGKCLAIAVVHPQEDVTPRIVLPSEWGLDSGTGHPGAIQQKKGTFQDRTLHFRVPRLSAGIPQWKVREYETGNATFFNYVFSATHDHCGDTIGLQMPRYQTHGLVTNRSKRRKKHGVDTVLTAPLKDLGGVAL